MAREAEKMAREAEKMARGAGKKSGGMKKYPPTPEELREWTDNKSLSNKRRR